MVEVKAEMGSTHPGWPPGHKYGYPCKCKALAGAEKRMKYVQPERPLSYKPQKIFRPPEIKMPEGTTYNLSYEAFDPRILRSCKGTPKIAKESLTSAGDFYDSTTHKMSYGAWPGIKRQSIIYPRDHRLNGDGPMQEVTTNRHDYTPKPIDTIEKVVHPCNLGLSRAPMENDSIMSMSYKCPDYNRFEPSVSYKPQKKYLPPDSPVDGNTVQKLSYMPWKPQEKPDMPWAKPQAYVAPHIPLDGGTIYNGSYIPPGRTVEDDTGHCKGCYCLYPTECFDGHGEPPKVDTCPVPYNPNTDPPRPPPIIDPNAGKGDKFSSANYGEMMMDSRM